MVVCPHCKKTLRTSADIAGRKVTCPACSQPFVAGPTPKPAGPRWFYAQDRQRRGPVTLAELANLVRRGELTREAMVLAEGEAKWQTVASVKGLFRKSEPSAPASGKGRVSRPVSSATSSEGRRRSSEDEGDGSGDPSYDGRASRGRVVSILALGGIGVIAIVGVVWWLSRPGDAAKIDEPPGPSVPQAAAKRSVPPPKTSVVPKPPEARNTPFALQDIDLPKRTETLVARLNAEREAAGLRPVAVDPSLSAGCQIHADYVARNLEHPKFAAAGGLRGEDPSLPGANADGRAAAAVAVQSQHEPTEAFTIWWGRLASRIRLMQPDLARIGVGIARNERGDWVTLLDPLRGLGREPIAYPASGQKDVPLVVFGGPEGKTAGHPISLDFPPDTVLADVVALLTDEAGNRIPSLTSMPQPTPGVRLMTTIGILPKSPLKAKTPYRMRITARVDDRKFEKTWEFTTEDDADGSGLWAQRVLERINAVRKKVGQAAVTLDPDLSVGCTNHARYLVLNARHPATQGLGGHNEDPSLPGATPQGAKAGQAADIALGDYEPTDAVDGWIATLYHRVPLLDPRLKRIGFGCARGERWITVVDVGTGKDKGTIAAPIAYPAADQEDVPLEFPPGGEIPDPIPENKTGRAGFPITITFPSVVKDATGDLEDEKGQPVPCWFSSPEKPANSKAKDHQGTTVCLIPKAPLEPQQTYKVRIAGRLGDMPWTKSWRFRTGAAGPSPDEAVRQVVERLNAVRKNVGLTPVVVDPELAKGCQAHAEYLRKNADLRKGPNFTSGSELPELPGYTAEGDRAAQRSLVLTDAPRPTIQIDDSLANLTLRSALLDPRLARIGVGCTLELGRGWIGVLDLQTGRTEAIAVPAAGTRKVPCDGFDRIPGNDTPSGFPIVVLFGPKQKIRAAYGTLTDSRGNAVEAFLSSPDGPLNKGITEPVLALHPRQALQHGQTYTATFQAIVDGRPWRMTWRFETAEARPGNPSTDR